ncbi:MAG TPA: 1,4-dihydroxy-2-naphthoate polyprenyltransferase [Thermoanaerobaculia bacterium]|nr:1,4-dihydroxy-2-naphthoate polyprenyltransferase [Thermoanaerobaculia bacterium]
MRRWLMAARPKTLSAAIVPVLMGSALASHEPTAITWWVFWCALIGAVLIQIATNLINDAIDFKKGADTAERLGPVRVTQSGLLTPQAVMTVAFLCLGGAALCGIPLITRGGWPMIAIGVTSILMAYAYTGGPFPLAYRGLGEIFVLIFFGFIAVGGTFYAHSLQWNAKAGLAGFAAGSLATVLLVINNLRDVDGDRRVDKRTTVVRFGETFARMEIAFFALAPFAAVAFIDPPRYLMTLIALPLALFVIVWVMRNRGAALNRGLALAGALQWIFGLSFVAGSML